MAVSGTPKEGIAGLIAALTNRLDEATVVSYAQLLANWNAGRTEATYRLEVDPGRMLGMALRGPVVGVLRGKLVETMPGKLKTFVENG